MYEEIFYSCTYYQFIPTVRTSPMTHLCDHSLHGHNDHWKLPIIRLVAFKKLNLRPLSNFNPVFLSVGVLMAISHSSHTRWFWTLLSM